MGQITNAASLYAEVSDIQRERGLDLMAAAAPAPGESVLDLGCGTGDLTVDLAKRVGLTGKVVGLDPDRDRLALAALTVPKFLTGLHFRSGKGEDLSTFASDSFDLVYSNYVFHWIADKERLMQEVHRCLKPGGRCAVELCGQLGSLIDRLILRAEAEGQELPRPILCRTAAQWRRLLEDSGFEVEQAETLDVAYSFASFEAFSDWWEGTTHGTIRATTLDPDYCDELRDHFDGGGTFTTHPVRFIARKPG
ncbi:MAG: hypothetical protein Kilf2KO_26680 [Rhodospirillales bacterium]